MAERPFRFIQAGDFHLERPLYGMTDVPEQLHDLCIDAPYRAAQRVFDAVLMHSADFLVLCGDIVNIELCGPRGVLFLREQFERLRAAEINVYWLGGEIDPPDAWPSELKLPDNVRLFSRTKPDNFAVSRKGITFAQMIGQSYARRRAIRGADFTPAENNPLFAIAAAVGDAEREALHQRVGYWALGGEHERRTVVSSPYTAHYAGTPQGRSPAEHGPHGCTLVEIVPGTTPHLQFLPCDTVRFVNQKVTLEASTTRDQLERLLEARMADMIASAGGIETIVTWTIGGRGRLLGQLRNGTVAAELVNWLRKHYGQRTPCVWSLSMTAQPDIAVTDDLLKQDTILGEYLRAVDRHIRQDDEADAEVLNLATYLTESQRAAGLSQVVALADPFTRDRVLRQAAVLGADLLTGEESHS